MSTTFMIAEENEKKRKIRSQQRQEKEYIESEQKLKSLNNKLDTVTNRMNDNFKKRIESLNTKNARTDEIKRKMAKYEEENKQKHFVDYLKKQMQYMKRMKKLEKVSFSSIIKFYLKRLTFNFRLITERLWRSRTNHLF